MTFLHLLLLVPILTMRDYVILRVSNGYVNKVATYVVCFCEINVLMWYVLKIIRTKMLHYTYQPR